jgi:hypothetical protein
MAAARPPLPIRHPRHGIIQSPAHLLLGLLTMLLLVMPVNYSAGTDSDHPHAFFQPVIDRITGHTHSHGEHQHEHDHAHGDSATIQAPDARLPDGQHDVPTLTTVKAGPDQPLALVAIGSLVLLLAAMTVRRLDWPRTRALEGALLPTEPPPPRVHSLFVIVPPGS